MLDGGRLLGFDGGEFGGGLWWFGPRGVPTIQLSKENVRGLVTAGGRHIVLLATSHGGHNEGRILEITTHGGRRQARPFATLPGSPEAYVGEPGGSVLILTAMGLVRVDNLGATRVLTKGDYRGLYPSSLVRMRDGTLYAGMRHYLVRLSAIGKSHKEEWFVRTDCRQFRMQNDECTCLAGR